MKIKIYWIVQSKRISEDLIEKKMQRKSLSLNEYDGYITNSFWFIDQNVQFSKGQSLSPGINTVGIDRKHYQYQYRIYWLWVSFIVRCLKMAKLLTVSTKLIEFLHFSLDLSETVQWYHFSLLGNLVKFLKLWFLSIYKKTTNLCRYLSIFVKITLVLLSLVVIIQAQETKKCTCNGK